MDLQTAQDMYREASAALREVMDDPDATASEIERARRASDRLALDFIDRNIADVKARTAQFAAFIRQMEQVIAAMGDDPILGGINKLRGIVDSAKAIVEPIAALFGDEPPPADAGGVAGAEGEEDSAAGGDVAPAQARRPGAAAKKKGKGRGKRTGQPTDVDDSPSYPKTTRVEAKDRREVPPARTAADLIQERFGAKLDAHPDRIDVRDWFYEPTLAALPDAVAHIDAKAVLDQGAEGACTGFALAAVINHHLKRRGLGRRVSERMLYEMARRYDEWPGESYEGSSARGAIKGWVAHGVCEQKNWKPTQHGLRQFDETIGLDARRTPGGAYYRVMHREVRDMHAAIAEVGILYCTLMVHDGWAEPGPSKARVTLTPAGVAGRSGARGKGSVQLPVIERRGRATSGHAVALVGYNEQGFIVQNSWGDTWGYKGFALLPYEDFLIHATDVWVSQLGVPVAMDLWEKGEASDRSSGLHRAAQSVPLDTIRPYVINVGNNGELSDSGEYWTTESDLQRLFTKTIPEAAAGWKNKTKRVLLYLHGGLNPEADVARRIVAFRDVMTANEIYPVHIMWETGAAETLKNIIRNLFTDADERAGGVGEWVRKLRENLVEAKDRSFELTAAGPGMALWEEMKRNARVASEHRSGRGAMQLVKKHVSAAMAGLTDAGKGQWELHVVAHSAGSIFTAYAIPLLTSLGLTFKSLQFMAPAISVDLFKSRILPYIVGGLCPRPTNYILSDVGERDDSLGPYGKSLLYLVSNAFENERETKLVGMERFVSDSDRENGGRFVDQDLNRLFKYNVDVPHPHLSTGLPSLVLAGKGPRTDPEADGRSWGIVSRSETHGGFDNDPETLNSVLYRILGHKPARWFHVEDLAY
jgi:hypothetical protein